jgi:hypothetical protein
MGSIVNLTFHLEYSGVGAPTDEDTQNNPDFTETTMSFDDFVDKLVDEISVNARSRFSQVPQLNKSINAPTVEIAWIEMMKAYLYDMVPTALANATALVEAAMKEQLTRKISDKSSAEIESLSFFESLTELKPHVTLTKAERKELVGFNDFERNTFIHQKTLTLLKATHPEKVSIKKVSFATGEEKVEDVPLESAQMLWPVLRRRVEREMLPDIMEKAVRLTNGILV